MTGTLTSANTTPKETNLALLAKNSRCFDDFSNRVEAATAHPDKYTRDDGINLALQAAKNRANRGVK